MADPIEEKTEAKKRLSDSIRSRRGEPHDGERVPATPMRIPERQPAPPPPQATAPRRLSERLPAPKTTAPAASAPSGPPAPIEPRPQAKQLLDEIQRPPAKPIIQAGPMSTAPPKTPSRADRRLKDKRGETQRLIEAHVNAILQKTGADGTRPITPIPAIPEHLQQVEFTPVQPDISYIRVLFDATTNLYLYEAIEPTLDQQQRDIFDLIRDTLVRTMDGRAAIDEANWEAYLLDALDNVILDHSLPVDPVSRKRLQYYVVRDFLGYGPIDILMRDPMIEDISCDGPHIPLFLFHRQYESIKTNIVFPDEGHLDAFVIRLAQRCGKQISIAEPILDATLPDKSRLNASLSREVTTRGSTFTIRKFRADPLTFSDLIRYGTLDARMAAFFWFSMENGASILFAGGTASGKTTTLNAVSTFIPPQKKIVTIEDTREINLAHENWIPGLTRQGFGGEVVGGKVVGTIDMYKLLESALRQRPEYLIVGEVRGPEALTLFQAMATGHATYSTLHADSVPSAVYRLENAPINVPRIMLQTLGAIAIHISTRVGNRMVRRIKEVVEIAGIDPETKDLLTNTVFQWDPATDTYSYTGKSNILDRITDRRSLNADQIEEEWSNRTQIIEWMVKSGIRKLRDVVNVISAYYSDPKRVLERVRNAQGAGGGPGGA